MAERSPDYLTVREVAHYLRLKDRKIYALAAAGEIPCSKATGRLLFPRAGVEAWLAAQMQGRCGPAMATGGPPPVVVGSHDPLLDWALRESRSGLASLFDGSLDGLERFAGGEALAAGLHLHDPGADDWNRPQVAGRFAAAPVVLLEWAWRDRGLIIAPALAGRVGGLTDIEGRVLVRRQPEAGSQRLLEALLAGGPGPEAVTWTAMTVRSETEVATAVADGDADAGFGLASVAGRFGLPFVPLLRERFDLLVWRRAYFEPPFQALLRLCRSEAFAARAAALGGYDVSGLGEVRFNGA